MGDVLTQSQIDALLSSVQASGNFGDTADSGSAGDSVITAGDTAGSDKDKKYRKYNFHTPKKFTKDRLKNRRVEILITELNAVDVSLEYIYSQMDRE